MPSTLLVLPIVTIVATVAACLFGYCFFVVPFQTMGQEWLDQEGVLVNATVVEDYDDELLGVTFD